MEKVFSAGRWPILDNGTFWSFGLWIDRGARQAGIGLIPALKVGDAGSAWAQGGEYYSNIGQK